MNKLLLLFALLFSTLSSTYAGKVVIEGHIPDIQNHNIVFFRYRIPFFEVRENVFTATVSSSGAFTDTFNIEKTTCIFAEAGPYLLYLFVEPGKNYKIIFPETENLPDDWKTNPYFKKAYFPFQVKADSLAEAKEIELNEAIRRFDQSYKPFRDKLLLYYYTPELSRALRDSFINAAFRKEKVSDPDFFENYRDYRKAMLEFSVENYNLDSLISGYISGRRINFGNPAYRDLFEKLFDDYFSHLKRKEKYRDVFRIFHDFDYTKIRQYLADEPALKNDTIFDLVLLHEVYKAFYSGTFNQDQLIAFTENMEDHLHSEAAQMLQDEILQKFTSLRTGYPAPSFSLTDIYGDSIRLSDPEGKYVYLGFCSIQSLECISEFQYLKYLNAKHKDYLKIITILPSTDKKYSNLIEMAESNSWDWTIISSEEGDELLSKYNIRAYPVFYLIGKEGNLVLSPAMNPSKGFEQNLFRIMKSRGDI